MRPLEQLEQMMQVHADELDVHIVGMKPPQIKDVLSKLLDVDTHTHTAAHFIMCLRTHGGMAGHPTLVMTHGESATLGNVTLKQLFEGLETDSDAYYSKLRHFVASNIERGTRMRFSSPAVPRAWRIFAYADDREATGVQSAWKRASVIIVPTLSRHYMCLALEDVAQLPVKLLTLEPFEARADTLFDNNMLFAATARSVAGAAVAHAAVLDCADVHASARDAAAAFNRDVVAPAVAELAAVFDARARAEIVWRCDRPPAWLLRDFAAQATSRIESLRALLDADMPLDPGLCARNNDARYITEMGKVMTALVQSFMGRIVVVTVAHALNKEAQPYVGDGAPLAAADLLALRLRDSLDFDFREMDVAANWPLASNKHVLDRTPAPQLATSFVQCVLQPWLRDMRGRLAASPDFRRVLDLMRAASLDG